MFKSTRRFLSDTADFLYEELEDRIVDMLSRNKSVANSELTSKLTDQKQLILELD